MFLEWLVDSFYEIAEKAFDDATKLNDNYQGHQYYKALNPVEIMSGKDYMYSYLGFESNTPFLYISKCGNLSIAKIKENFCFFISYIIPEIMVRYDAGSIVT